MADLDGIVLPMSVHPGAVHERLSGMAGTTAAPNRERQSGVDREQARLDPWCMVALASGEWVLFGFSLHHVTLGGLSWMTTSPVRYINPSRGTARLANRRRYGLGRQFAMYDVMAEGLEACLALEFLLQELASPHDSIPRMSCDPETDRRWLVTRKMARHLAVRPPVRDATAIQTFWDIHAETFAALRTSRGGPCAVR